MAFNSVTFRVELDPLVKKELDHDFFVLEEWQSAQHKDDGSHAAITADSVYITGDLTVLGFAGFEDLSVNVITASEITTDLLTVNTTLVLPGAGPNFISAAQVSLLDQTIFNFGGVLSISSSTVFVSGPVELNAESTDTSGNAPLRLKNRDDTVNNWIEMSFYGGDNTGPDPLPVEVGRYGMQVMSHGAIPLADFVWKNQTAEIMRLNNGGDLLINTNKFTVDGATGDTGLAGVLTASKTSGSLVRHSLLNPTGNIQTDLRIGKGTNTNDLFIGANYADAANAFIDNRSGGDLLIKHGGATDITIESDGDVVMEQDLRVKGTLRFDNYPGGFLETDGSGNVSANVNVLQANGVGNSVQFLDTGFNTITLTVVDGQVTVLS